MTIYWHIPIFITAFVLLTNANEPFSPGDWAGRVFLSTSTSQLWIEGSSNVNQWKCNSDRPFGKGGIRPDVGNRLDEEDVWAWLEVPVSSFDCGNPVMNRDFKNALKAEKHPVIRFELKWAETKKEINENKATINVLGKLNTAGSEKEINFPAKIIRTADGFRITGEDTLQMPDFGITPPTALWGLIKAHPQISIHFDIIAEPLVMGRARP